MGDREYNREYAKSRYADFRVLKDQISLNLFGGKCFLCGETEGYQGFHLHHVTYHPDDSSYRRNSKAQWTREMRVKEAQEHPERFTLLCPKCHRLVTSVGNFLVRQLEARPDLPIQTFIDLVLTEMKNRLVYVVERDDAPDSL